MLATLRRKIGMGAVLLFLSAKTARSKVTKSLCALAVVITVMAFDQRAGQAYEAPWCAVVGLSEDAVYWDCQYRSFEDCYPHVLAGNRGFCNQNPGYQGEPRRQYVPRHRVRHHQFRAK